MEILGLVFEGHTRLELSTIISAQTTYGQDGWHGGCITTFV